MQTKTIQEDLCSLSLERGSQQHLFYLLVVNIFLSIGAVLGNSLILVAFRKESSLHPPSKLLYRCLATTDLMVGVVSQPLATTYQMSIVYEHWSICRYARYAAFMTSYALCGVSLSAMMAISMDRLLALLLGLRYRQIVTLKRTFFCVGIFWVVSSVPTSSFIFDDRIALWYLWQLSRCTILLGYLHRLVHKNFPLSQSSSGSSKKSTTAEPTECTEHCAIQKGSTQCTLGTVGTGCLLFAICYSG